MFCVCVYFVCAGVCLFGCALTYLLDCLSVCAFGCVFLFCVVYLVRVCLCVVVWWFVCLLVCLCGCLLVVLSCVVCVL